MPDTRVHEIMFEASSNSISPANTTASSFARVTCPPACPSSVGSVFNALRKGCVNAHEAAGASRHGEDWSMFLSLSCDEHLSTESDAWHHPNTSQHFDTRLETLQEGKNQQAEAH